MTMTVSLSVWHTLNFDTISYDIVWCLIFFTVLTVAVVELTTNVYENNGSVRACLNITHGFLESGSPYIRYYTYSGSANGMQYHNAVLMR